MLIISSRNSGKRHATNTIEPGSYLARYWGTIRAGRESTGSFSAAGASGQFPSSRRWAHGKPAPAATLPLLPPRPLLLCPRLAQVAPPPPHAQSQAHSPSSSARQVTASASSRLAISRRRQRREQRRRRSCSTHERMACIPPPALKHGLGFSFTAVRPKEGWPEKILPPLLLSEPAVAVKKALPPFPDRSPQKDSTSTLLSSLYSSAKKKEEGLQRPSSVRGGGKAAALQREQIAGVQAKRKKFAGAARGCLCGEIACRCWGAARSSCWGLAYTCGATGCT